MRTLVYGAGPLGSLYAARLQQAGVEVALLARGQRLSDLREHGVVLEDAFSGQRETHHVPVVEKLEPDDPYDLVIVVMRKDQSLDILPTLAKNQHAHTVLFLQNNAAGFDDYADTLGADKVMVGFPASGGERQDPVMRVMPMRRMPIPIGEIDGSVTERTRAVAALLDRMPDKGVQIRRDMDAWLVTHIPAIMGYFGLFAAEIDPARYARTPDAMLLGVRARTEALRAQQAAGIPIRPPSFRALPLIPEAVALAILRAMANTAFFEVGIAGHCRVARDEVAHLMTEYRRRISAGGMATPHMDAVMNHIEGTTAPLPEGSREQPVRWTGTVAMAAAVAAPLVGRVVIGRRKRR